MSDHIAPATPKGSPAARRDHTTPAPSLDYSVLCIWIALIAANGLVWWLLIERICVYG